MDILVKCDFLVLIGYLIGEKCCTSEGRAFLGIRSYYLFLRSCCEASHEHSSIIKFIRDVSVGYLL